METEDLQEVTPVEEVTPAESEAAFEAGFNALVRLRVTISPTTNRRRLRIPLLSNPIWMTMIAPTRKHSLVSA